MMQLLHKRFREFEKLECSKFCEVTIPNPDKPTTFMNINAKFLSKISKLILVINKKDNSQWPSWLILEMHMDLIF